MATSLKKNFDAAARGIDLTSTKNLRIVDYADADQPLRVQMEAAILPIDKKPESRKTVVEYGGDVIAATVALYLKVDNLSQSKLIENAAILLPQALETVHELDGYIGGVKEILRRYDEVHIPQAVRKAAASGAHEDLKRMREMDGARNTLLEQACVLEGARCLGKMVAQRLELGVEHEELMDIVIGSDIGEYMRQRAPKKAPKAKSGPRKR